MLDRSPERRAAHELRDLGTLGTLHGLRLGPPRAIAVPPPVAGDLPRHGGRRSPQSLFVADDLDRARQELGPYLMHDVRSYASWNEGNTDTASISFAQSADELRRESRSHRIVTFDDAVALVRAGRMLPLHPLVGGLPPEIAWPYLRTVAERLCASHVRRVTPTRHGLVTSQCLP